MEEVNLGASRGTLKPVFITSHMIAQEKEQLVALLKKYVNVFAWTYNEMSSLDLGLVVHSLNIDPGVKPIV